MRVACSSLKRTREARMLRGRNREQLLLAAEPADRVQEEIAVVELIDVAIVGDLAGAEDHQSCLAVAEPELLQLRVDGDADRDRSLGVDDPRRAAPGSA
jgi:hypothetical protein